MRIRHFFDTLSPMNITTFSLLGAILLAALAPLQAADDKTKSSDDKKSLRVLAAPDRERRMFGPREGERREAVEMETVAFLGVETGPVSPTLGAQLGLARGTGLVVNHVLAKSPAAGALREHDILLQLDDQILIETRQLSVLIRLRKEG
jgi:serine protease Do